MNVKIAIAVVLVTTAAGLLWGGAGRAPEAVGRGHGGAGTRQRRPGGTVEITMLYSAEKREWLEEAAESFRAEHPEVQLTLSGKGSLESAQGIAQGTDRPALWSPADSLDLALLRAGYRQRTGRDLWAETDQDRPRSLFGTPLVFVIWDERAEVLLHEAGGQLNWHLIHEATTVRQGWPALGGLPDWGKVKLGHADPTRSHSGLQALLLMTFEYHGKSAGLTLADVQQPGLEKWIGEVEQRIPRFPPSTASLMADLLRFGPSQYDMALVYENQVVSQIEAAQERWGTLRAYYPPVTQFCDHPAVLLLGDWVSEAQKKAARLFLAHLHSRPVQERALHFGFRPADIPLDDSDPQNPFVRLHSYGLRPQIPQVGKQPDLAVVQALQALWRRAREIR